MVALCTEYPSRGTVYSVYNEGHIPRDIMARPAHRCWARHSTGPHMHVVVNEKLVRTKLRLAWAFHLCAFVVYAAGLWVSSTQPDQSLEGTAGIFGAIVVGLLLYSVGQGYLRRWGPRMRQDGVLAKVMKGLDNRYSLLAFPSTRLPDYILIGPGGVQVIVPRALDGTISCRSDRWTREGRGGIGRFFSAIGRNALGDPGLDVSRGIQGVREHLRKRGLAGDHEPPLSGLVVFTNPNARLRIEGCSQTVTGVKQLRNHIRTVKGPLNPRGVTEVVQALVA